MLESFQLHWLPKLSDRSDCSLIKDSPGNIRRSKDRERLSDGMIHPIFSFCIIRSDHGLIHILRTVWGLSSSLVFFWPTERSVSFGKALDGLDTATLLADGSTSQQFIFN